MVKSTTKIVCILLLFYSILTPHVSAEQNIKISIDNYVETFLREHQIPGASIMITHDNELFYSKEWGVTGESEEKVTTKTPFTLGSISKSLTGLAIMTLIEEDMIHLEDPVQTYIPWFTLHDKKAAGEITIKHLLTHSSGISTYSGLVISDKESKDVNAIKKNVKNLANVKLTASPGEKHQYSNANFLILGALIEEVTNQTYSEYMEQHVFQPLDMKHAAADHDTAYKRGYLAGYESWLGIPRKSSITYDNGGAPYGYIAASAEDMVQYIKFLSRQGDDQLLTEHNMNLYVSPLFQTAENRYYGFGLRITNPDSKDRMIWHSGSTPDSHAELFFLPETGWGGVILTNKNHVLEEAALPQLKNGIINLLTGKEPVEIPKNIPLFQLILIGVLCCLLVLSIYLVAKVKEGVQIHRRGILITLSIIFLMLSVSFIPLLTFSVDSPWHAIKAFAPDIGLITKLLIFSLAFNSLLIIYFVFKKEGTIRNENEHSLL